VADFRKEAKGRNCLIRIPGHCNQNAETVVLCHYRMATGVGQKPHDLHGAFGCSGCHDAIDQRVKSQYSRTELRLMHLEGVIRTQLLMIREGKL